MVRVKTPPQRSAPGRVRIIGGALRGSVLAVPDRPGLRPTPVRLRETLFNWLQPTLAGARCLDLFAGSGALGIEALSRGAACVCLVERDAALAAAIEANLERLRQGARTTVRAAEALALLAQAPPQAFDVAFLDPPFADDLWLVTVQRLEASGWLTPHALIYAEMPVGKPFPAPPTWIEQRAARAGEVRGVLYRRRGDPLS